MPLCEVCRKSVPKEDLKRSGRMNGLIACPACRAEPKEKKMAETKREPKKIMSFHIYEIPVGDGVDHEVEVEGGWGGMNLKFKTTFDKVRDFFTKRREQAEAKKDAGLKAVK